MTLASKYDRAVPRYTSYPTAAQFHPGVGPAQLARWLGVQGGRRLAHYVHVPFCRSLCWYCACHTTVVNRPEPLAAYAENLAAEAALMARHLPEDVVWAARQWGGGTPTHLGAPTFLALSRRLDKLFPLAPHAEHSVELDPRAFDERLADALAEARVTRASLGVQDFDPAVQRAIHRRQSAEETAAAVVRLRARGIGRINLDLVYGLPQQTLETLQRTLGAALALQPDRFAVFGYAHVPWMKRHQRLIDQSSLPDAALRHAMSELVAETLQQAGYRRIGLDHYALADDGLARAAAQGRLRRSFQGYSDLGLDGTLGLGASAITDLPEGLAQNAVSVTGHGDALTKGRLATVRGVARGPADRLRGAVIERLLCDFSVDLEAEALARKADPLPLLKALDGLAPFLADGLVEQQGWRLAMTPGGRPWVRAVAALFDEYLPTSAGRHSRAV